MRHSEARSVTLSLRCQEGATVLEVSDDGVGFEPALVRANPVRGHFGLRVLGDLAREAGADLRVASAPGEGTRWCLRVPDRGAPSGSPARSRHALFYARHADRANEASLVSAGSSGAGADDWTEGDEGLLAHAFAHQAVEEVLEPHPGASRFLSRPGRLLGMDVTRHRPGRP
jgi:hypothetical protein